MQITARGCEPDTATNRKTEKRKEGGTFQGVKRKVLYLQPRGKGEIGGKDEQRITFL